MSKRLIICPSCHTNLTLDIDLEPGKKLKIVCPYCNKTGEILSKSITKELDFYSLYKPFSYVKIVKNMETVEKLYIVIEATLSDEEQRIVRIFKNFLERKVDVLKEDLDLEKIVPDLPHKIKKTVKKLDEPTIDKIFYFVKKDVIGYGLIDPLMHDPAIEDISCTGSNIPLFLVHRTHGSLKTNLQFNNQEDLYDFVNIIAQKCGKAITKVNPMLDANLPDGSRIQMTLGTEVTSKGSTFSIRKFHTSPFTPVDLLNFNTMSADILVYFWLVIENRINALFAGQTASGKTTVLNAFSFFIPRNKKVVSIEETREINLSHPNWIPCVARPGSGESTSWELIGVIDIHDLLKAALRQRPEYLIVGEVRGEEAYALFQAMSTGHATYSTIHADSTNKLINRLIYEPINIPRHMLPVLDVVSFQVLKTVNGKRVRRCKQVVEVIGIDPDSKELLINEVFHWDQSSDVFIYSGKSYILDRICNEKNMTTEQMMDEMNRRKELLKWMNINNIRYFEDVSKMISIYNNNPDVALESIKKIIP